MVKGSLKKGLGSPVAGQISGREAAYNTLRICRTGAYLTVSNQAAGGERYQMYPLSNKSREWTPQDHENFAGKYDASHSVQWFTN
jgi:hypothetical protein